MKGFKESTIKFNDIAKVAKVVWGIVITLVTIALTYGQFVIGGATVRPSVALKMTAPEKKLSVEHSVYSHKLKLENKGSIIAKGMSITVVTHQAGKTPHEDNNDPLNDLLPGESTNYVIYVYGVIEEKLGIPKFALSEKITLTYVGESIFRFWCKPVYKWSMSYVFNTKEKTWDYHQDEQALESKTCE